MNIRRILATVLPIILMAGCTATESDDVLTSAVNQPVAEAPSTYTQSQLPPSGERIADSGASTPPAGSSRQDSSYNGSVQTAFASEQPILQPQPGRRNRKTYIINGLASNIGNIGYGFTNLSKKIPGSKLYNYASFVESSTVIRSKVTKELKQAYKADPNVEINLIGISFGANIVTIISQELHRSKIPVNYLATLDGPAMVPVRDNVRINDNFTCTNLDCFKTTSRLAWGNKTTTHSAFRLKSSHIPLANHEEVHSRIIAQINAHPRVTSSPTVTLQ